MQQHQRLLAASYTAAERKCKKLLRDYEIKKEQQIIMRNNAGSNFCFVNVVVQMWLRSVEQEYCMAALSWVTLNALICITAISAQSVCTINTRF